MSKPTYKPTRFLLLVGMMAWCMGCLAPRPSVPDRDDVVMASLSGLLVMECVNSEATICAFVLPAGRRVRVVTPDCKANCLEPSLSPDGQVIVFTEGSPEGAEIWQVGADGQNAKPLVQGELAWDFPAWSPDGSMIAYRVLEDPYTLDTPDGHAFQVYRYSSLNVASADGTGETGLTRRDGNVLAFDWAPDSDRLVTSACLEDLNQDGVIGDEDRERLYVVDLATGGVQAIFNNVDPKLSMHAPSWSPDGAHIAFIEGHGHPVSYGDLVVMEVDDGSEVARLDVGPGAEYAWSPNGNEIAYVEFRVSGRVGYEDLSVLDLSTGDVTRVTDTSLYSVFSANELNGINLDDIVWSPGGNYLAFVWRTEGKDYIVAVSADGSQLSRIVGLGSGYHHLTAWGP